jgi:hypothetical protein
MVKLGKGGKHVRQALPPMGAAFLLAGICGGPARGVGASTGHDHDQRGLFASRSGAEKKAAAMSFVSAALQLTDAVTSRHIVDPDKFKQGLSAVIDGTVLCLNASTWSKPAQP